MTQTESLDSYHDGSRLSPEQLMAYYKFDEDPCNQSEPAAIALFDDMLTTGSHFKAMKTLIHQRWPEVSICGVLIARRYFPGPKDNQ